jgi:hypothetical protein
MFLFSLDQILGEFSVDRKSQIRIQSSENGEGSSARNSSARKPVFQANF